MHYQICTSPRASDLFVSTDLRYECSLWQQNCMWTRKLGPQICLWAWTSDMSVRSDLRFVWELGPQICVWAPSIDFRESSDLRFVCKLGPQICVWALINSTSIIAIIDMHGTGAGENLIYIRHLCWNGELFYGGYVEIFTYKIIEKSMMRSNHHMKIFTYQMIEKSMMRYNHHMKIFRYQIIEKSMMRYNHHMKIFTYQIIKKSMMR